MNTETLNKIADEILQLKNAGWDFRKAGYHILNRYGIREGAGEVLSEIGSLLGRRNRGVKRMPCAPRKKPPDELELFFGRPREEIHADAALHEAQLNLGIEEHDR